MLDDGSSQLASLLAGTTTTSAMVPVMVAVVTQQQQQQQQGKGGSQLTASQGGDGSSAAPTSTALPVFALFASSGRGEVLPSDSSSSSAEAAAPHPLDLIVAPLSAAAHRTPVPHADPSQRRLNVDPRCVHTRKGVGGRVGGGEGRGGGEWARQVGGGGRR